MNPRSPRVKVAFSVGDVLGECPLWDSNPHGLWWIDIKRRLIHFADIHDQSALATWEVARAGQLPCPDRRSRNIGCRFGVLAARPGQWFHDDCSSARAFEAAGQRIRPTSGLSSLIPQRRRPTPTPTRPPFTANLGLRNNQLVYSARFSTLKARVGCF